MDINPVVISQNDYNTIICLCLKESILKRERKSRAIDYLCWLTPNVQKLAAVYIC